MRALDDLSTALARWFGPFGYHAVLARAVAHAAPEHPVLESVTVADPLAPSLVGLDGAAATHGVQAAADAVEAVLAAVIALLERIVGEDMVLYLVEPRMDVSDPTQAGAPPSDTSAPAAPDDKSDVDSKRRRP